MGIIKKTVKQFLRGYMEDFDVIVIGAGPGGYVAAIRAAQAGFKTAVVDREWLGGVCLNVGCIPSKALLKNAEVAHLLRERGRDFGFSFDNLHLDYGLAVKRSRQVSDRLTKGVGYLMKKNNIEVLIGEAAFSSNNTISVRMHEGAFCELKAKNIIIATGSSTVNLPGIIPDGKVILTYRDAILQDRLPARAVIIGGGAIGVEFATIWNSYGVDVTIVEMLPQILPMEDSEVAQELTRALTKRGIKILTGARVEKVGAIPEGAAVSVKTLQTEEVVPAAQVLVAVGFKPNTAGLGLDNIGLELSPKGYVIVDERMATNIKGIWAVGDVTGKLLLAHVASAQAIVCLDAITGKEPQPLDYRMMPRATYCQPQVASFGLTEQQALEQGLKIKVGKFPFQANGKSLGLGESSGFVKIIIEEDTGIVIGSHMIGPEVSELLPELTLAQGNSINIEAIARNVHAHPTLSESILEAAHGLEGEPIHI
jgi:dihydrolipoamide dehydrogenase